MVSLQVRGGNATVFVRLVQSGCAIYAASMNATLGRTLAARLFRMTLHPEDSYKSVLLSSLMSGQQEGFVSVVYNSLGNVFFIFTAVTQEKHACKTHSFISA